MSFGRAFTSYGSALTSGPLGVIQIAFNGYNLGLTVDNAVLKPDLDIKDILYQQKGTKAADHIVTGADWVVTAVLGEINTELLKTVAPYLFDSKGTVGADSGTFKADLYESLRDTVAGVLKIASVKDQNPSSKIEDTMFFYVAIPLINSDLIQWGADVQRNLPIEFKIKSRQITAKESTTYANKSVYGYFGDPTVEDLPAAEWPDTTAPFLTKAEAVSATSLVLTASTDIVEADGASTIKRIVTSVESVFHEPTKAEYADNVLTVTFAAGTFVSGKQITVSIGAGTFKDGKDNENTAICSESVLNSV